MRMERLGLAAIGIALISQGIVISAAEARENRTVKCYTYRARWAESAGGPALIANVSTSMTPIDLNAVLFTDKQLGRSMVVEGVFAQRTPTNGVKVTARFVNCTKQTLAVQLRSNFMDANQIPTEKASSWKTVFLSPLATAVYEESSIGRDRVDAFLIELRPNL
jgi:hypothetical protein